MHVRTILSPSTEASNIELAEFLLLGQLNVMTEVAMFPLLIIITFIFKYLYDIHNYEITSTSQITQIIKCSYPGTTTFDVVFANGLALLVLPMLVLLMLPQAPRSILQNTQYVSHTAFTMQLL